MSQPLNIILVDHNGIYRTELRNALTMLGFQVVASVGSAAGIIYASYGAGRLKKADIMIADIVIIDGETDYSDDIILEILEKKREIKVIEHSSKKRQLSSIFVPKGAINVSASALCEVF